MIAVMENNYGHAAVKWFEFLTREMKSPAFIPGLKKAHEEAKNIFFRDDNKNPGALRAVSYFASIMATARLLAKCFKWDLALLEKRVMDGFHLATMETEDNAPKHQKALKAISGWVHKNINKFIRKTDFSNETQIPDRSEIWGLYNAGEYVAIDPHTLETEFLEKHGFSKSVISQWRDEGYLDCEPGRLVKPIRTEFLTGGIMKGKPRFYCIKWDAFDSEK